MDPLALRTFTLFRNLTDDQLRAIGQSFGEERHRDGHRVFSEGDQGDRLYLIVEGSVRISQSISEGTEEALAVLKAGQYFGDMSLIDAQPRSADAIAASDSLLYTIDRRSFLGMLKTNPELAVDVLFNFMHALSGRLRETNHKVRALNIMAMW